MSTSKHYEVIEGDCTGCTLCAERAPDNLEVPAGSRAARVFKQPETPEEEAACREASDYCPAGALLEHGGTPAASAGSATSTDAADRNAMPGGDSTPADQAP